MQEEPFHALLILCKSISDDGSVNRLEISHMLCCVGDRPLPEANSYDPAMSKLLLNLRNVPDDEADDVRAMLHDNAIEFYETRPSLWGLSSGGIWVTQDAAVAQAKRLMADYQQQRQTRARAAYAEARRTGTAETFWTVLRAEPGRVLLTLLAIAFMLALVALPVVLLRG